MHLLQTQCLPYRYDLGFDRVSSALVIHVELRAWEWVKSLLKATAPIVQDYAKWCPFTPFIEPLADEWGFGPVMKRVESPGPDAIWRCSFALSTNPQDRSPQTLASIFAISTLLQALNFYESALPVSTTYDQVQLMEVDIFYVHSRPLHRFPIHATLAPSVSHWLRRASEDARNRLRSTVRAAARQVYANAIGRPDDPRDRFLVEITDRTMMLQVPGDACTLAGPVEESGQGTVLSPHNVDCAAQQLALLAGASALCEALRDLGL